MILSDVQRYEAAAQRKTWHFGADDQKAQATEFSPPLCDESIEIRLTI